MAHIYPFGIHLALDFVGIALLGVFVVGIVVASICVVVRKSRLSTALYLVALASAVVLAPRGLVAPAESWPVILAAYDYASGEERLKRRLELRDHWRYGEIRIIDWWLISDRWGVCHAMWKQESCLRPPGPYEAQGIAREMLDGVVKEAWRLTTR